MLLRIHSEDPQPRHIRTAADCLRKGGIVIYPTDTIYGLGCDIYNAQAIERICRIKNLDPKKAQFSFICSSLSHLTDYAKSIDTPAFRVLKQLLPGPYTIILPASKQVPRLLKTKKDTVGIRIPDNRIALALIKELGHPIMSTSLPMEEDAAYFTDPELMHERFRQLVDIVIDGGVGSTTPSTVLDLTSGFPQLVREGAGEWNEE